jgi:ferredoxin-nitrite reductase
LHNDPPKPDDNFRWRFFGLFYCAPTQKTYMCRLRIPNGILKAAQLDGVAEAAERHGGGYAHVTTRANLQIREVEPKNAIALVEHIQDIGLRSRGSGADNIRNVTGTPTAGIDPQELIDTRPYARDPRTLSHSRPTPPLFQQAARFCRKTAFCCLERLLPSRAAFF